MTDLVVVSLERWDEVWRRNQYLVDGLLRADPGLRVLFVEPAADPLHDLSARRRPAFGRPPAPVGDTGRLWAYRPVKALPRRIDPRADGRLSRSIMRAAQRVGFEAPLLWLNDPGLAAVMDDTGWSTLYDITDDWLAADRPAAELARLTAGEQRLLTHATEVVACSPELVRRKSPQRGAERHPIVLVRNAVDVDAYRRPRERPADLPAARTAVYAGTLHADRFDVPLAAATARTLGEKGTLVLVGPNLLGGDATRDLLDAGVVIVGARPVDQLIAYLQHADVLVVPHRVDAFTDSLDPIKLYEYQSVGRPVVSTPVAGFRDAGDTRIAVVARPAFAAAVLGAVTVSTPSTSGRPGGSVTADWGDRVEIIRALLERIDGH